MGIGSFTLTAIALVFAAGTAYAQPDAVKQCQVEKMQAARIRAQCVVDERIAKVERKTPDFAKCEAAFAAALAKADATAAAQKAACRFIDNGDGTISDLNTLLMWEKRDRSGDGVHDKGVKLTWVAAMSGWLSHLNGLAVCDEEACPAPPAGFAGYTDWRLPTVAELRTLVDTSQGDAKIAPIFNANCADGCRVVECGCVAPGQNEFWSSTMKEGLVEHSWLVNFDTGTVLSKDRTAHQYVRAVRGGR